MKKLVMTALLALVAGCAHSAPETAATPQVPDTPEVAAGKARVHAGHGLQRMSRADENFARPPEFFVYMLVRAYVNRNIKGAPGMYDYASSVVWVWAEKGHGTMAAEELAATAGCKSPEGWALAYSGIVVPKTASQRYDIITEVYKEYLHRETVGQEIPCQWSLYRQTF
jgi:hypothetical protein